MTSKLFPSMYINDLGTDPLFSILIVRLISLVFDYPVE